MKLAEALIERKDLQNRIDVIQNRLMNNARVQDGETPAEDPMALMAEQKGISMNDAFDIFDSYLDDGHAVTDFLNVIVDVFKSSGIIKSDEVAEGKN